MRKGPGKATKAIWDEFSGHYLENFCVELNSKRWAGAKHFREPLAQFPPHIVISSSTASSFFHYHQPPSQQRVSVLSKLE